MFLLLNAVASALLPQVLAQQLTVERIDHPHMRGIPLHVNPASDPARRRAVVGGLDFDVAVQMHGPLAIEVITKRLHGQRQQRRFLLCEHGRDLPFGRAVNAGVGPPLLPVIQIRCASSRLSKRCPFNGVFCAWPTPDSTFPFRSGSRTRHGKATAP